MDPSNRALRWLLAVAVVVVAGACSDDDDADPGAIPSITDSPTTSEPATTPPTTSPPTTDPPTTASTAPPTTSVDDLKAQIAADHVRSWELRDELVANPTLENLDARVAEITVAESTGASDLRTFVEMLVATGQRVAPNDPDLRSVTVENVELEAGPPYSAAMVTSCFVDNRQRVDANGVSLGITGELVAVRSEVSVAPSDQGWLPDGPVRIIAEAIGVTRCPSE